MLSKRKLNTCQLKIYKLLYNQQQFLLEFVWLQVTKKGKEKEKSLLYDELGGKPLLE